MDKAQAYAVLRIEPGCTQEEIKEAYAALSRQYHPEEYPEEFQQIHDAYRMLRRREQRHHTIHPVTVAGTKETDLQLGDVTEEADLQSVDINVTEETELQPVEVNVTEEADPETSSGVSAEQELEEQTENPEQSEAVPQYDFDEVIEEEQREEEQKQIYFIQKALIEMEMLLKPQYCNKVKLFQEYFRKAEYQEILKQPVYMGMFAELLENSRLKPVIYDHIIDYYRFRGLNPEDMYEGAAKLYRVLDEKRGMKKKKTGTLQTVILVGAVAGVRAGTRSVSSDSGAGKLFGFLAVHIPQTLDCQNLPSPWNGTDTPYRYSAPEAVLRPAVHTAENIHKIQVQRTDRNVHPAALSLDHSCSSHRQMPKDSGYSADLSHHPRYFSSNNGCLG